MEHNETRPDKGKSLLVFPDEYTVIDTETTGLDPKYDEIIEVSALRIKNGILLDTFDSLVKPNQEIDAFIEGLTGISNEMVAHSPSISDILPGYIDFIGCSMLLGQNVSFDINFLYDLSIKILNKPFNNDFVDLMRISRRAIPDLEHHGLSDISEYLHINANGRHRAIKDCEITNACYVACKDMLISTYGNAKNFYDAQKDNHSGRIAKDIHATVDSFDEDHPLFQKHCVFTGALSKMTRREAMQRVANVGGLCDDGITAKTNFLIVGSFEYSSHVQGNKSSKIKKAEKYILDGKDLKIISESVFFDMI